MWTATVQYLVQAPTSAAMNNDGTVKYDSHSILCLVTSNCDKHKELRNMKQFYVLWQATVTSIRNCEIWHNSMSCLHSLSLWTVGVICMTLSQLFHICRNWTGSIKYFSNYRLYIKKLSCLIFYFPGEVVLLTQSHGTVHYIWQDIQMLYNTIHTGWHN